MTWLNGKWKVLKGVHLGSKTNTDTWLEEAIAEYINAKSKNPYYPYIGIFSKVALECPNQAGEWLDQWADIISRGRIWGSTAYWDDKLKEHAEKYFT